MTRSAVARTFSVCPVPGRSNRIHPDACLLRGRGQVIEAFSHVRSNRWLGHVNITHWIRALPIVHLPFPGLLPAPSQSLHPTPLTKALRVASVPCPPIRRIPRRHRRRQQTRRFRPLRRRGRGRRFGRRPTLDLPTPSRLPLPCSFPDSRQSHAFHRQSSPKQAMPWWRA